MTEHPDDDPIEDHGPLSVQVRPVRRVPREPAAVIVATSCALVSPMSNASTRRSSARR